MSEARAVRLVTPGYQAEPQSGLAWNLPEKIAFRFFFAFFLFGLVPFFCSLLPWLGDLLQGYWGTGEVLVATWAGTHLLHLAPPSDIGSNGSGDSLYSWVASGCEVALSLLVCALWSLLDRKRPHYRTLHGWLRIGLRFQLASTMLSYGALKVFRGQFSAPVPGRLLERVGEMSPMGLLWTFMGASASYTLFAGLGEVLGGVLLFFRRTVTLGALVVMGMMTNVVMLNFSYDVPVKIYSSQLLLTALFLIAPDLQRLAAVLVFNRSPPPADLRPPYSSRGLLLCGHLLKLYLVYAIIWVSFRGSLETQRTYQTLLGGSEYEGNWKVEEQSRDGVAIPPLATDATRWQFVSINWGRMLQVRTMAGTKMSFRIDENHIQNQPQNPVGNQLATIANPGSAVTPGETTTWAVTRADVDHLSLEGTFQGAKTTLKLARFEEGPDSLMKRGFHWVNEFPLNR